VAGQAAERFSAFEVALAPGQGRRLEADGECRVVIGDEAASGAVALGTQGQFARCRRRLEPADRLVGKTEVDRRQVIAPRAVAPLAADPAISGLRTGMVQRRAEVGRVAVQAPTQRVARLALAQVTQLVAGVDRVPGRAIPALDLGVVAEPQLDGSALEIVADRCISVLTRAEHVIEDCLDRSSFDLCLQRDAITRKSDDVRDLGVARIGPGLVGEGDVPEVVPRVESPSVPAGLFEAMNLGMTFGAPGRADEGGWLDRLGRLLTKTRRDLERDQGRLSVPLLDRRAAEQPGDLAVGTSLEAGFQLGASLGRLVVLEPGAGPPIARRSRTEAGAAQLRVEPQGPLQGLGCWRGLVLVIVQDAESREGTGRPLRQPREPLGQVGCLGEPVGSGVQPAQLEEGLAMVPVGPMRLLQHRHGLGILTLAEQGRGEQEEILGLRTLGAEPVKEILGRRVATETGRGPRE
jgi:hypothetical protein